MKKLGSKLVVLALVLIFAALIPIQAKTTEILETGNCGDDVAWSLDVDGTLTISGTGPMSDFSSTTAPWYEMQFAITKIVIEDGVTSIGKYAFYNASDVVEVSMGTDVTSIGYSAFYGCTSLAEISLPSNLKTIGDRAFFRCSNLRAIELPGKLSSIGNYGFYGCNVLNNVYFCGTEEQWNAITFGSQNTKLLDASRSYHKWDKISCGETRTCLICAFTKGPSAHNWKPGSCTEPATCVECGIAKSSTPDHKWNAVICGEVPTCTLCGFVGSVCDSHNIIDGICYSCMRFGTCGENLYWTFDHEGTLTISGTGDMPSFAETKPSWNCLTSMIKNVVIDDGVTSIGDYAFYNSYIKSITFGDDVVSIGEYAFYNCSGLTTVELPDGLTSIGKYAFYRCRKLTSIDIPDGVTSIGDFVFFECSSLTTVELSDSLVSIGVDAFGICSKLTSIDIPEGVTSIGAAAFTNCSELTTVKLPDSLVSIGNKTFNYCSKLTSIDIPDGVTSIGTNAFYNCSGLTEISIGAGVTNIGSGAFYGCSKVKALHISNLAAWCQTSFSYYYDNPLYYAKKLYVNGELLEDLVIPEGVTEIGAYAFYYCTSIKSVTFPKSLTSIGSNAFNYCSNLTAVHIKDLAAWCQTSFTSASSYYHCDNPLCYAKRLYVNGELVEDLVIPEGVTTISAYAFYYCTSIKSVTFPEGLTSIGNYAFYNCDGITSVTFPESLTSIGAESFNDCSNLQRIVIPQKMTNIGNYAFYYCTNLSEVIYCGTQDQWQNISIGYSDSYLTGAKRKYHQWGENGCTVAATCVYCDAVSEAMGHAWVEATCTDAKHCSVCLTTEGEALGHKWVDVSCLDPRHCSVCGVTDGEKLEHTVENGICTLCKRYGSCGEDLTWELDSNGTLTISGSGAMPDYAYVSYNKYSYPWNDYSTSIKAVVIEEGVTRIGNYAFNYCSKIVSITIPSSVTSIGEDAFYGIGSNGSVYISDIAAWCKISLENKYANPLYRAVNLYLNGELLTELVIPNEITVIGDYVFYGADCIVNVTFHNNVTEIGKHAFYNCSGIKVLTIPEGVTKIGEDAFRNCDGIEILTIPDSVQTIDSGAFYSCSKLVKVTFGKGLQSIGSSAFSECTALTEIKFTGSDFNLSDKYCFSQCTNLQKIDIPDLAAWCKQSFMNAYGSSNPLYYAKSLYVNGELVTELVIPEGVTSIGNFAFINCDSIKSICFPDSLTTIGQGAFVDCDGLTSVTIPANISTIGQAPFAYCTNLTGIWVDAGSKFYTNDELGVLYTKDMTTLVAFPATLSSYSIPNGVTTIGTAAFSKSKLMYISFPATINKIEMYAFYGSSELCNIRFTNINAAIGEEAFGNCKISSGKCGENVYYVWAAGTIYIYGSGPMDSYTSSSSPFYNDLGNEGVDNETTVILFQGVTSVGDYAFMYNNSGDLTLVLPSSVKKVGYVYSGYSSYVSFHIIYCGTESQWDSVTVTGGGAYYYDYYVDYHSMYGGDCTTPNVCRYCGERESAVVHKWVSATCMEAKHCSVCGLTEGEPRSHYWYDATCTKAKYCSYCKLEEGTALGHNIVDATCQNAKRCTRCYWSEGTALPHTIENEICISCRKYGTCGENLIWKISGSSLYISGSGAMNDYTSTACPWAEHRTAISYVTINQGVTSIGEYAFSNCTKLSSVYIPNSVTLINSYAFNYCSNLKYVTFCGTSSEWYSISKYSGNTYLTNLTPEYHSLTTYSAFIDYSNSSYCTICNAYGKCGSGLTWTITDKVLTISGYGSMDSYQYGDDGPWGYQSFDKVIIKSGVTSFNADAIGYVYGDFVIPSSVTSISGYIYGNVIYCGTQAQWNALNTSAYCDAYHSYVATACNTTPYCEYCGKAGTEFVHNWQPATCTTPKTCDRCGATDGAALGHNWQGATCIDPMKCSRCGLTEGTPGGHVLSSGRCTACYKYGTCGNYLTWTIDDEGTLTISGVGPITNASWNNYNVKFTSVVIEEGVTLIPANAFSYYSSSVVSIKIPASVVLIYPSAFNGCSSLTDISVDAKNKFYVTDAYGVLYSKDMTELLVAPVNLTSYEVPTFVTSIGSDAFANCENLESVYIIDLAAWCKINFADSSANPLSYADKLYWNNELVIDLNIPNGITSISAYAFYNYDRLKSLTIPGSVESIGDYAFAECGKLSNLVINDGVTSIGNNAFYYDTALIKLVIPNSVTSIGQKAFSSCSQMVDIKLGNGVTVIGNSAFSYCSNLMYINLPQSITTIGADAFNYCSNLRVVIYCGTAIQWEKISIEITSSQYADKISGNEALFLSTRLFHDFLDATCDTPMTCALCGETKGEALGHTYAKVTILPTCMEDGYDRHTCTICGSSYTDNVVAKLGHHSTAVVTPPTCTTGGYTTYTCSRCGDISISDPVNALGHSWIPATCTKPKTCSVCSATTGNALGHAWIAATCTTPKTCSVCGVTQGDPLGHKWINATCVDPKTCSACGLTEGNPLGHSWGAATCTTPKTCAVCGSTEGNALGHSWIAANCTTPKTCSVCGVTEGKALGHSWVAATCTTPKTCSVCGVTEGTVVHKVTNDICTVCRKYGLCGDNLTWTLDDAGMLTIFGTGAMRSYSSQNAPWYSIRSALRGVVIEDGVTSISDNAFYNCTTIVSLNIADSVTTIGSSAFSGCARLSSVVIPDSVTFVGGSAFNGCIRLATVSIGCGISSINTHTFSGCSSLKEIVIPEGVTTIGYYAFYDCSALTGVTIPSTLNSIRSYAFSGCYNLNAVYISDITAWCKVYFESDLSNPLYNGKDLYLDGELVTDLVVPEGITQINSYAFYNCDSLITVTIPSSVTDIGESAFEDCDSLTSVAIAEGVTTIGSGAFDCCSNLEMILLPKGLDAIFEDAFRDCDKLEMVYHRGSQEDWDWIIFEGGNSDLTNATIVHDFEGTTLPNACEHEWQDATCTEPKTCVLCGRVSGTALGHNWINATCTAPKTCSACGLIEGNPLQHLLTITTNAKDPTCTEDGCTIGLACVHDGCSYGIASQIIPATGHNFVDGTCTTCGKTEGPQVDENLTITSKDMLLGGYIGAQFTVNPEVTGNYDSVYIVVVFDGLEFTYNVPLYEGAHVFEHRVAPKYMGEALQITAYGVKGEEVIPGITVEWSIKDGIMERLAKFYPYIKYEQYKNRCILLVDMLYYGAEAQVRFGTNGNGLVTDGLDEGYAALKTATEPTIEKVNTATQTASNQLYQVNLGVEDAVQMQFTFRLKVEDYSQYLVKITANGTTYEYTGESFIPQGDTSTLKKFVTVVFDKLEAVNMRDDVTIELWQNGAKVSNTYIASIEGFATASIAKDQNVALLKAMITYGDSAKVSLGK